MHNELAEMHWKHDLLGSIEVGIVFSIEITM